MDTFIGVFVDVILAITICYTHISTSFLPKPPTEVKIIISMNIPENIFFGGMIHVQQVYLRPRHYPLLHTRAF